VNDKDYQVPFRFNGTISKLTFNLKPAQLAEEEQRKMRDAVSRARD
jgi:arylsulfatase